MIKLICIAAFCIGVVGCGNVKHKPFTGKLNLDDSYKENMYKIPFDYHFGYDSIQILVSAKDTIVNFCFPRSDTIRTRYDAAIIISDSGSYATIDSNTSIFFHWKTKKPSGIFEMRNSYFSPDSVNANMGGKHILITNLKQ